MSVACVAQAGFIRGHPELIPWSGADMGFGRHFWQVDVDNGVTLLKLFYAGQMLYIFVQVFAKLAILLLLRGIFEVPWFKLAVRIIIVFLFVHGIVFILIIAFQCNPVYGVWEPEVPSEKCMSISTIGWAGTSCSLAEDVAILLLPLPEVFKLQMNLQRKLVVIFIFSLGSL